MSDIRDLQNAFSTEFGEFPDRIVQAPGRVNLIGEHTDYNDGFVLPAAISLNNLVAVRRRDDTLVCIVAHDFGNTVSVFDLAQPIEHDPAQPWSNYVRGMAQVMRDAGVPLGGMDMMIMGTIPQGSGLSSSASLCVATGLAMGALSTTEPHDPTTLALMAQRAENDFVGMRCGNMDQLASAHGQEGHALLIDCRSLAVQPIPLPKGIAILIVHSGITRGLVEGKYNERRAQCEAVAQALGVPALRDISARDLVAAKSRLDPVAYRRARHVISENARTLAAAEAMAEGDILSLGALMVASHASMRDDFEITLPAIDTLVQELVKVIGEKGGARMTGGGFGGAVVALLPEEKVEMVVQHVSARYRTSDGTPPIIMVERASAGASVLKGGAG